MKLTAQEIFDRLINEDQIKTVKGQIRFHLGDVSIIVKRKDVVGNIVQEWLEGWLIARGIEFDPNPNTQMPPDVYLNPENHTKNLLEIKAFNRESSPAFDIADFKAFVNELIEKPYHLDTDFLIFGYAMDEQTGDVVIKDLWLKKIWEITKTMDNWPITVQYKNGILQKCVLETGTRLAAIQKCLKQKKIILLHLRKRFTKILKHVPRGQQGKNRFKRSYKNHYGVDIDFPKWDDIKTKYGRT